MLKNVCPYLVARGAAEPGLDGVDADFGDARGVLGADEEEEADAHQLLVRQQREPVLAAAVLPGWVGIQRCCDVYLL